jgi:mannose-6-phosphate isomerase-like protein (cupin superfamily)
MTDDDGHGPAPFVRRGPAGERYRMQGTLTLLKATAAETGGAFGLVDQRAGAGLATPLHVHHGTDECWLVLDGRLTVRLDGETTTIGPGDVAFGPCGRPHAVRAETDGRWFVVTNAGGEALVPALGAPTDATTPPAPEPTPADRARIDEAAPAHGLEILGPPPFDD